MAGVVTVLPPKASDPAGLDPFEAAVTTTLEHLRFCGITTPLEASLVFKRATEIMESVQSTYLPNRVRTIEAAEPDPIADCPRCGAAGRTFQSTASEKMHNGIAVTRIALACVTPLCGFVET